MYGVDFLRTLEGRSISREVEWLDILVYAEEKHPEPGGAARFLERELGVSRRSAERYLAVTKPGVKESQQPARGVVKDAVEHLRARIQREWDRADDAHQRRQVADLLRAIRAIKPGRVKVRSVSRGKGRRGLPRTGSLDGTRTINTWLSVDLADVADLWEQGKEGEAAAALSDAIVDAYGNRGDVDELSSSIRITGYPLDLDYR